MTKKERIDQLEREIRDLRAIVQTLQASRATVLTPPPALPTSAWPLNRPVYGSFTNAPQTGFITPVST